MLIIKSHVIFHAAVHFATALRCLAPEALTKQPQSSIYAIYCALQTTQFAPSNSCNEQNAYAPNLSLSLTITCAKP